MTVKRLSQVLLLLVSISFATETRAQITVDQGQQDRPIKALSDAELLSYLNGEGPGDNNAAELNRYPGPREVLDLASQLGLTEPQRQRVERIYDAMHQTAMSLGKQIVSHEAILDSLFSTRTIDSAGLHSQVSEIARLEGELREARLQSHLAVTRILSRDQILTYDRLRGHSPPGAESGRREGDNH